MISAKLERPAQFKHFFKPSGNNILFSPSFVCPAQKTYNRGARAKKKPIELIYFFIT